MMRHATRIYLKLIFFVCTTEMIFLFFLIVLYISFIWTIEWIVHVYVYINSEPTLKE